MGFISFNLNYYKNKIEYYENNDLSSIDIYEAKQLLKILDDLLDEEYTYLNQRIEEDFKGVTRLKSILSIHNEKTFKNMRRLIVKNDYKDLEYELGNFLTKLENITAVSRQDVKNTFIIDVLNYSRWITYDENTAYIFLLRDTMLPYLYFKKQGRANSYPWLIGRKFLNSISNIPNLDDAVRAIFFDALENGCRDFLNFKHYFNSEITKVLEEYSEVVCILKMLLSTINKEKIMVIESGCHGTFPMLLAALDDRVDFRMFTTVPYMKEVYRDRIYTDAYENNRLFETLTCQDLLFEYADFRNNMFYIRKSENKEVNKKSERELQYFFSLLKQ